MPLAAIFAKNPTTGLTEPVLIDPDTGGLVVTTLEHYLRHTGKFFHMSGEATIAAGASVSFLADIPVGLQLHADRLTFVSDVAPLTGQLLEDVTTSNDGTPMVGFNTNRRIGTPPQVLTYAAPTITDEGTKIAHWRIAGTKQEGGLGDAGFEEFILNHGYKYAFRLTNPTNTVATVSYVFEWAELT